MPWVVTLKVVNCASPSAYLAGAAITDGYNIYSTDVNGQFIAVVDDAYTAYVVQISKSGYSAANFTLSVVQNGTIQTTCLNPAKTDPPGPTGPGPQCFIVTAASGSEQSDEVVGLRQLRDRVAGMSRWSASLIDEIYREYEQFSPAIAESIEDDALVRQAVLRVVVRPLVAWYSLAGKLALDSGDHRGIEAAVRALDAACPRYLGAASIVAALNTLNSEQGGAVSGSIIPAAFRARVQAALGFKNATWAILDPLVRAWTCATERRDVIGEVAGWLAHAPLDLLSPVDPHEDAERECAALSAFMNFRPDARRELGKRLLVAWPRYAEGLARHGFV